MGKKNKKSVDENITFYNTYFEEDLKAIEEELEKSKEYSQIIDSEIRKLEGPSLGVNKGAQKYLIEHITNAVQLQTQRQGLRRDRFAIKKAIIDYAAKFADEEGNTEGTDIMAAINKLLNIDKNEKKNDKVMLNEDLDAEIDQILKNEQ